MKNAAADELMDFAREIVPILTRSGCNQGGCHGAQHGKGGFRLSLFGFDPTFDHPQIVQSAEGRRVVAVRPGAQHPAAEAGSCRWSTAAANASRSAAANYDDPQALARRRRPGPTA